jgi:hypothetical protein
VQVKIFTDSGGLPSATQVGGTATIAKESVTGSFQTFSPSFSSQVSLTSGQTYWIVFMVSAGESDSNYYASQSIIDAAANNGAKYGEDNNDFWVNNNDDLYYVLNGTALVETNRSTTIKRGSAAVIKKNNGIVTVRK